jgi:lipoprotein Spr
MKKQLLPLAALLVLNSSCSLFETSPKSNTAPQVEHELLKGKVPTNKKPSMGSLKQTADEGALESFIDEWYGTPHRLGGMTKKGVDCSGFVILAYRDVFNKTFRGRRAEDLVGEMQALDQSELEYGDLVFFKVRGRRIDHVGIYLGDRKFAHTSASRGVMTSSLDNSYWSKRYFKGGRYKS